MPFEFKKKILSGEIVNIKCLAYKYIFLELENVVFILTFMIKLYCITYFILIYFDLLVCSIVYYHFILCLYPLALFSSIITPYLQYKLHKLIGGRLIISVTNYNI